MENPNEAYLVLATDLPYIDESLIFELIAHRNPKKIATTVKGIGNEFPEPLITIWEPKAYPILMQYLAQGYSCPRKVLINSDIKELRIKNTNALCNVNTPEELKVVKR